MNTSRWLLVSLLCVGCGSYDDDVKALCGAAPSVAAAADQAKADPIERVTIVMAHYGEHVKTEQGRALAAEIKGAESKPEVVKKAMSAAGVTDCPSLAVFEDAADYVAFGEELRMMCVPKGELESKLSGVLEPGPRLAILEPYLEEHLRTQRGKELLAQARDKGNPAAERASLVKAAYDKQFIGAGNCYYAEAIGN